MMIGRLAKKRATKKGKRGRSFFVGTHHPVSLLFGANVDQATSMIDMIVESSCRDTFNDSCGGHYGKGKMWRV